MTTLSSEQLDELQAFLKEWLRHTGRTQADLRRALRAGSIRMPVLLGELERTSGREGLTGLAERLCGIEEQWQGEEAPTDGGADFEDPLGQLDLLLEEIRADLKP